MVRSLRARIQLWHGLTLFVIIAGLGAFLYARIELATFQQVDVDLEGSAQLLVALLKEVPAEDLAAGQFELPELTSTRRVLLPPDRPRPRRDREPRPERQPPARHIDAAPYFIVWNERGDELYSSLDAPLFAADDLPSLLDQTTSLIRQRRDDRQVFLPGPLGTAVMVGRSMSRDLAELSTWRWVLVTSGLAAIALGTLGGGWLLRRALQPLERMSATAATMSGANLSRRLDTQAVDSELEQLGSALNAAFDRLEADFQKQTRFTADASHELRTPLTVILGHLELALAQPAIDPRVREALTACQRAAKRMKSLIEQLLLLASADAGKLIGERQLFDFSGMIEECLELLAPLAREKQLRVSTEIAAADFQGDPRLLGQVVINLITNAIVHNRSGGELVVSLAASADQLVLRVADTGSGINPEAQAHLFERFYRIDSARGRESGGAGLGLAIAQSIVRAHGGEISVQSEVGRGSTFIVALPLAITNCRRIRFSRIAKSD